MEPFWAQCWEYWRSGGLLLVPQACVCWGVFFYYFRLRRRVLWALRMAPEVEQSLGTRLARELNLGQMQRLFGGANTFFRQAITHVFEGLARGLRLEEVCAQVRAGALGALRRDLTVMEALIGSAPLLGLLGTALGMIQTFRAVPADAAVARELIAAGVSTALVTTQVGLTVALPGLFAASALRRRIRQLEVRLFYIQACIAIGLRGEAA